MTRARDLAAFVSNADGDIKFDTDTLFIDSSANRVGIGTNAPSAPSEIVATSSGASTDLLHLRNNATASSTGGTIKFVNSTAGNSNSGSSEITAIRTGTNTGDLAFSTSDSSASITERMRISSSGNLGIGVSPAFPLDVSTNSSTTNDAVTTLRLSANTTGTAANNFGVAINFSGEDASGSLRDLSTINGIYTDATNRSSAITFKTRANLGSLTEEVRIDPDGLKFNGDTAAANALDDYEEGTWTPVVQGGTSSGTYTPQYILGRYTKIGARVLAETTIYVTGFNGTGDFQISGLPFSCKSSNPGGLVSAQWNSCPFATYSSDNQHVMGLIPANQSYIHFRASDRVQNGTHVQLQCGPSSITYLRLTISYEA